VIEMNVNPEPMAAIIEAAAGTHVAHGPEHGHSRRRTDADKEALRQSLHKLRQEPEADLVRALHHVVTAIATLLGHDGAGIMFVVGGEQLRYIAVSDEPSRSLEEAQISSGQGPCYDSYIYDAPVVSKDLHSDARWPQLAGRLDSRVRAAAMVPIRLGGHPIGILHVYRDHSVEWSDTELQALHAYSALTEEILLAALAAPRPGALASQLYGSMADRVVIDRAIGYLMATDQLDAATAFDQLRRRARERCLTIDDLAAQLLAD
jgi:hypothetical protein